MKVKIKSICEAKLEELTQEQFNKWDSARQQQWLNDHPNSKFKPQGQTKQDIASRYDADNDEDSTKWTGTNSKYKDKLVKDHQKAPDKDYEEFDASKEIADKLKYNKIELDKLTKNDIFNLETLLKSNDVKYYLNGDSEVTENLQKFKDDFDNAKKGKEIRDNIKNKLKDNPKVTSWLRDNADYNSIKYLRSQYEKYSPGRNSSKGNEYWDKYQQKLKSFNKELGNKLGIEIPEDYYSGDYSPEMYNIYKDNYISYALRKLMGEDKVNYNDIRKLVRKLKI